MLEDSKLGSLDVAFFGASLGVTVFIGLYFANKNKTFADYARGGGNQNLWAVSASMAAGYCSALTLIGNPSELYMHGTSFTVSMATTVLGWPISSFVFLPVFRRLEGISIFQYIENRYNAALRRFISLLFIFQMTFYSAVALYLPSLPLMAALKIPQSLSIGFVGCICIIYSTFGGIKAVTWTNLYHSMLTIFAMLTIILTGLWHISDTQGGAGITKVLSDSYDAGRLSLGDDYFKLDLKTRHTIFNTLFGYTLVRLFLHGTSQMQIQSALSLSSMRKSQASQLISSLFYLFIQVVASFIGLILFVNYRKCDPYASGEINRQDELLVHYVSTHLNGIPAMQGVFIAAIFGSTLTTMSSYQSSTSAMVVEDFIRPLYVRLKLKLSDELAATLGKLMAFILGLTCIVLTFEMDKISGLQQATTTLYGVIGVPILVAFMLGVTTHSVNAWGMFSGMLAAILFGAYVFVSQIMFNVSPLEPSLPTSIAGCSSSSPMLPNTTSESLTFQLISKEEQQLQQVASEQLFNQLIISEADLELAPIAFDLAQMSYMWLPLFNFVISVLVALLVSWLTGGWTQQVNERLLTPLIITKKPRESKFFEQNSQFKVSNLANNSNTITTIIISNDQKCAKLATQKLAGEPANESGSDKCRCKCKKHGRHYHHHHHLEEQIHRHDNQVQYCVSPDPDQEMRPDLLARV